VPILFTTKEIVLLPTLSHQLELLQTDFVKKLKEPLYRDFPLKPLSHVTNRSHLDVVVDLLLEFLTMLGKTVLSMKNVFLTLEMIKILIATIPFNLVINSLLKTTAFFQVKKQ